MPLSHVEEGDWLGLVEAINRSLADLENLPLVHAVTMEDVVLASGTTTVLHTLGRIPAGFLIIDRSSAASVFPSSWTSTTITFTASAAVTVDIMVF